MYYIPKVKTNIISVGQVDEIGFQTLTKDGVMHIRDTDQRFLAKNPRALNSLYVLNATLERPVSLSTRAEEDARCWHAHLGHLNFPAPKKMANEDLVRGMPQIKKVNLLWDGCLADKHRHMPFPEKAEYQAERALELVHGDLCGPITPPTRGGKKMFLLLVDDFSRFMWIVLLSSKDQAADAIKRVRAEAEAASGNKLRCL